MPTIKELQKRAYDASVAAGWHPEVETGDAVPVLEKLALVHSEVSEAVEAYRNPEWAPDGTYVVNGKPEGIGPELADTLIRCMDLAESLGIDLESCVLEKMAYNATRAHRHGGKRA